MKLPMLLAAALFAFGLQTARATQAVTDANIACKKRHPLVYTSYTWTTIEPAGGNTLLFRYGNGIDDQMLEIYFESLIEETAPGRYEGYGPDYALTVEVRRSRLSFTLKTARGSDTRRNFTCL